MARPSKFKPEYIEQAENYCLLGATDAELAKFFKVNVDTIYEWKKVHPEFSDATKTGKEVADQRVVNSLYQKACGYELNDRHYPADTTAAIFWLKNRIPDDWKDVKERHHKHDAVEGDTNMIELARRIAYLFQEGLDASQTQH